MDSGRVAIIVSCWISITVIASVYMIVFASKLSDVLFGVFLPVGLLVLAGMAITIALASGSEGSRSAPVMVPPP